MDVTPCPLGALIYGPVDAPSMAEIRAIAPTFPAIQDLRPCGFAKTVLDRVIIAGSMVVSALVEYTPLAHARVSVAQGPAVAFRVASYSWDSQRVPTTIIPRIIPFCKHRREEQRPDPILGCKVEEPHVGLAVVTGVE